MATVVPTITRYRGDTAPDPFTLVDSAGAIRDITIGYTFIMTVSTEQDPVDDTNQLYAVAGVVMNGPTGSFEFRPTLINVDQIPATYFYDVQVTDPSGYIKTVEKGKYVYKQDIGK